MEERFLYSFRRKIRNYIEEWDMIRPGALVLCAVSGGADSVCLLNILSELTGQLHFRLEAVHVEHGIRGEESLSDCIYVEELCRRMGVPLTLRRISVPHLAEESKRTIEEEARIQRYRIFRETAEEKGASAAAVAHNQNDQAETVLFNMIRGSGIRGLAGIRPVRKEGNLLVVRPLLCAGRTEIERYLQEKGIAFCTDRTNRDLDISRNRIRLQVLPELLKLNRQAAEHIASSAENLAETEQYLERETKRAAERCIRGQKLQLESFSREDPVIRKRVLRECIRRFTPGQSLKDIGKVHIRELEDLCLGPDGRRVSLPKGVTAIRQGDAVIFRSGYESSAAGKAPQRMEEITVALPFEGEKEIEAGGCHFSLSCGIFGKDEPARKKFTKWLAYDTIAGREEREICFRSRRPGDFLVISQGGGRKKISDYMTDCKIPKDQRDRLVLVTQGSHVLWVPGGRISEAAKVRPGSPYVRVSLTDGTV